MGRRRQSCQNRTCPKHVICFPIMRTACSVGAFKFAGNLSLTRFSVQKFIMASGLTGSLSAACGSCNKPLAVYHLRCSRCQTMTYCNTECQRTHWKLHKKACKASVVKAAQPTTAVATSISAHKVPCEMCSSLNERPLHCSGCQTVSYCNADCQRAHWKLHKKACKDRAAANVARFTTAAVAGDAIAQYNLGLTYYTGMGVVKDVIEAARWFLAAAVAGYACAQCNVGKCYEDGTGVAQDCAEAGRW